MEENKFILKEKFPEIIYLGFMVCGFTRIKYSLVCALGTNSYIYKNYFIINFFKQDFKKPHSSKNYLAFTISPILPYQ